MKQRAKIYCGILAFTLVLAACPTDSGTPPDTTKLNLSGQVYIQNTDPLTLLSNSENKKYNGNLKISDGDQGGSGEIKDGQLNYSIGIPKNLSPINEDGSLDYLKGMYSSLNFSSEDVKAAVVALEVTDSDDYSGLFKILLVIKPGLDKLQPIITITIEAVNYVYVDKDLNITVEEGTFNSKDLDFPDLGFPIILTTEKINLNLNKGWNSLYSEITAQVNIPMDILNPSELDLSTLNLSKLEPTGKLKMSVGDSETLKWTLVPSLSPDIEP